MSEIIKAAMILLVMPATNASSKRSFSTLKQVKTYLRSSTTDHLMMLHVHHDKVDDFVGRNDRRKQIFGCFTERDLCKKLCLLHESIHRQIDSHIFLIRQLYPVHCFYIANFFLSSRNMPDSFAEIELTCSMFETNTYLLALDMSNCRVTCPTWQAVFISYASVLTNRELCKTF